MNENKVKVWLARDKNGVLCVHCTEPLKTSKYWISCNHGNLEDHYSPSVKWEDDEPTEAYITLTNEPQPKKEIDWEQRRYEIAKDILSTMFFHPKPAINRQEDINFAVKAADMLINKLKEKSK